MSGPVRLLALDIDGTLLRSDRTISARTREAVAHARAKGVRVVLVTGRRLPAARRIASALGPALPLVLHNGALVVEPLEGDLADAAPRILRCVPLAKAVAGRAIELGRQAGADPVVHAGRRGEGRLIIESLASTNPLLGRYLAGSGSDLETVADLVEALDEDPLQVMFGGAIEEMAALSPRLAAALAGEARVFRTLYPSSGVGILDVLDSRVGKAEALAFLRERWGVSAEETLAIGDNWNDHEMLEQAGRGLVMGNADPALCACGLEVLPTNDEDGVAVGIERYVLG